MFTQFKLYIIGGVMAIVLAISGYMWIQNVRIDKLKSERDGFAQGWAQAKDANAENVKTIDELKKEREKAGKSCEKRLADKQALIDNLNKIDATTGGNNEADRKNAMDNVGDPLLDLLNGMLPGQGGGQDGVCQAGDPAVSGGAPVVSGAVRRYIFCSDDDVKNFLKDWALCRAWALDGVQAIEGMR